MEFYMNEQRELVREMVREFVEKNGGAEAYTTRAVLDGDEWVINGSKCFVTLIGPADEYIVKAVTGDEPNQISYFMVPRETSGFSVGKMEDKVGWRDAKVGLIGGGQYDYIMSNAGALRVAGQA